MLLEPLRIRESLVKMLLICIVVPASMLVCAAQGPTPTTFTNHTNLLGTTNFSGVAIGIADMNGDGRDDIIRYNQGTDLNIQYQTAPKDFFDSEAIERVSNTSEWSTAIADVDGNGFNDIIVGGSFNNLKLLYNQNGIADYVNTNIQGSNIFIQGLNFVDIDNDGHLDIFACNDVGDSRKFVNNGRGIFSPSPSLINTETVIPSDNSGNYSSVWTDYDNDGDLDLYISKCKIGANSPTDPRRVNMLLENDGNNNFTEVAERAGLAVGAQTWTADFADIDNDGDLDAFIANHYDDNQLFINNGNGTFTDITVISGLNVIDRQSGFFAIQTLFRDFNNDGYVDLLVTGNEHFLFYNNGNRSFTEAPNPFGPNDIESVAVGDLDHNGYLDIYAGYAELFTTPSRIPDEMYLNNGNGNNFIAVQVEGTASNSNAIGARIEIYGSWGIQIREVRSGEGYGIMNSFTQHFGLGSADRVDRIVVKWPSGTTQELRNPAVNAYHKIIEESDCLGACNDGDPCTVNDTYDSNCNCIGNFVDSDRDGVCDTQDFCPDFNNNLIGTPCNDGNPCTIGETYNTNCGCSGGVEQDEDNDGICAALDQNDNDPCIPNSSTCESGPENCSLYDFTGFENQDLGIWIDGGAAASFTNNPVFAATGNSSYLLTGNLGQASSIFTSNLPLSGAGALTLSFSYLPLSMEDGDGFMVEYASNGTDYQILRSYAYGVQFTDVRRTDMLTLPNVNFTNNSRLRIRTATNETSDYIILDDISVEICSDNVINCVVGTACDDGNPCTIGEALDVNCNCGGGTIIDSDNDGICDANDTCPNFNNALIGQLCNDNDPCTTGERWDNNCGCSGGIITDADNDGLCAALDVNDNDACVPNNTNCNPPPTGTGDPTGDTDCTTLAFTGFENGAFGNWQDGGQFVRPLTDPFFAFSGTYSYYLQGNGGIQSSIFSIPLDATPYESLLFTFDLFTLDVEDGDQLIVEYSNDEFNYTVYATATVGQEIINDARYNMELELRGIPFGQKMMVRLRAAASSQSDFFILDNMRLQGCSNTSIACAVGTSCDDGNACTIGSVFDSNCDCVGGSFLDGDGDGVCDTDDRCPNFNNNLIGQPCNDGDPCTVGEVWNSNCGCSGGTIVDNDGDGFCFAFDPDDNNACLPNSTNANCADSSTDCVLINETDFEGSDLGIWNVGGDGAKLLTSEVYANSGVNTYFIQGNLGAASSLFTNPLNLSTYESVIVEFYFHAFSLEDSDRFHLEIGSNGNYIVARTFERGIDFNTDDRISASLSLEGFTLTNNMSLRFRAETDSFDDFLILDDIRVSGCGAVAIACVPGTACDDGDPCTLGERYDGNCNCIGGTLIDADRDGICIGNDVDDNDPCRPNTNSPFCNNGELNCEIFESEDFETNSLGTWESGGTFGVLFKSETFSDGGEYIFYMRGNAGRSSSLISAPLNVAGSEAIEFTFNYLPLAMTTGDSFVVEIARDGVNFQIVKTFVEGTDFINETRYIETVVIDNFALSNNTRVRIRTTADNDDYLILDAVSLASCSQSFSNDKNEVSQRSRSTLQSEQIEENIEDNLEDTKILIYPNPTTDLVTIALSKKVAQLQKLSIYNTQGQLLKTMTIQNQLTKIDLSEYKSGMYLFKIETEGIRDFELQRIIKQ